MKSAFEKIVSKIKSLDKKVLIAICAGIVVVIAIVVALIIGFSGNDKADNDTDKETKLETEIETEADTEEDTEEVTEEEDEVTEEPTETEKETTEEPEDTFVPETDAPYTEPETQAPQYLTGPGSASEPFLEMPDSDMTFTTVSVPAGSSVHYNIYRVGGMIFTINSYNAYVIHNGVRYDAYNGVVTFKIANALASDSVYFEIGNKGLADESFKIQFSSQLGSYSNPQIVSTINTDYSVSIAEGSDTGYYFKYYAEMTGTIRFYMSASADSVMLVTNNRNSAQRTTDGDVKTDEQGRTYIEMEVNQGDELLINVGAVPSKRGKYPAVDITWSGKFN